MLKAYGIRTLESAFATSPTLPASIAQELGFAVALKAVSDRLIHKTGAGGVILDRRDADEVRRGFDAIVTKACSQGAGGHGARRAARFSARER